MKKYSLVVMFFILILSCSKKQIFTPDILQLNKVANSNTANLVLGNATLSSFEVGAYLPYWGLSNYQDYAYNKVTTLYMIATISKASVLENKGLIWGDNDDSPNAYVQPDLNSILSYIRSVNPSIKIILALSDLHTTDTKRAETATLFNSTNRTTTVAYLMSSYIDNYDFDGIDVDFEDTSLDPGYIYMNYPLFVKSLADSLHNSSSRGRGKLCTATLGQDYNRPIITADFVNSIDLLGMQDYGSEKMDYLIANPYRNLKTMTSGWAAKVPRSKLSTGLAAWSIYVTSSGAFAEGYAYNYNTQLTLRPDALWYLPYLTTDFNAPGKPSGYMQRYNGLYETRRKAEYSKNEGLKGVFIWDITKDAVGSTYGPYSYLSMLIDWNNNPSNYAKIVGYTTQDYYSSSQSISVGFHDIPASTVNWVGVYDFQTGASIGYYQYLANTSSGTLTIPASTTAQLQANKLYILRFYNGANGIGNVFLGTSHPFYKL